MYFAAATIYAAVAASLAERKKGSQLTELLKNIKGLVIDEDWDQVILIHYTQFVVISTKKQPYWRRKKNYAQAFVHGDMFLTLFFFIRTFVTLGR